MIRDFYAPPAFLIDNIVRSALEEDFGHGFDITSCTTIPAQTQAKVALMARQTLPLAGLSCALSALRQIDSGLDVKINAKDGDMTPKGTVILEISGSARSIMSAERVALNFIGHLSGIALLTSQFVEKTAHTHAKITCTRKTLPNLRFLQKYAVRVGGGFSHRAGLDDCVLIKDNHIAVCGGIAAAVASARASLGHTTKIELECDTLEQVKQAIAAKVDIIMLDNMSLPMLREAVTMINGQAISEASGGVTLNTVKEIAETGVNMISVGAITHSAPYADVAFDFISLS